MEAKTIIIGGGVSGLAAAAFSSGALVLERLKLPGRKLLVTGGGRCNVTHDTDSAGVMAKFGKRARFMGPALDGWDPASICKFLNDWGVPTVVEDGGCVFPASGRSGDVLDVLVRAACDAGAEIRCGVRVKRLLLDEAGHSVCGVETSTGEKIASLRVILAAGGKCKPELGSDGSGLEIAQAVGLRVTPVFPSLGSLITEEKWIASLAGLSCESASIKIEEKGFGREPVCGSVMFTHKGLSGPAALEISGEVAQAIAARGGCVKLKFSCRSDWSLEDWFGCFESWRQSCGTRLVRKRLAEEIPKALAEVFCKLAEVGEDVPVAHFNRSQTERLAALCAACPLTVTATDGWDRAMITRGGVALSEIDPDTMACRKIKGLFCVGELVDLDAPCGGYNLTWALASGRLAAVSSIG